MKTFYNVVNAIICSAKEARASIVLDIEWVQYLSCKIVKTCRIIGLNRAKKNKLSCIIKKKKQRLIVLFTSDVMKQNYV